MFFNLSIASNSLMSFVMQDRDSGNNSGGERVGACSRRMGTPDYKGDRRRDKSRRGEDPGILIRTNPLLEEFKNNKNRRFEMRVSTAKYFTLGTFSKGRSSLVFMSTWNSGLWHSPVLLLPSVYVALGWRAKLMRIKEAYW